LWIALAIRNDSIVGSYLYDAVEVGRHVVAWPEATRLDVEQAPRADACDLCLQPRAPRNYYELRELADWAKKYGRRGITRAPGARILPEWLDRCICCESQLEATIAIPRLVLEIINDSLSHAEREFLCTELRAVACGVCRNSQRDFLPSSQAILDKYLELKGVSVPDFNASREAEIYRAIALRIDEALQRLAS
jgi:hypothetical protein